MLLYPVSKFKASGLVKSLLMVLFAGLFIAGCETTTPQPRPQPRPPVQQPDTPKPDLPDPETPEPEQPEPEPTTSTALTPPFMAGSDIKRLALILPFSAQSERLRDEAQSMLKAAELSLFSRRDNDVLLIALDSAGTAGGAAMATRSAIEQGADVILGPILAASVQASGREARKSDIPVIAFSTDTSVAQEGIYLLSFPPEAEVKRITQFVAESGAQKFAYLGPNSTYGQRVLGAYQKQISDTGGMINGVETYSGKDITVMQDPAERLARRYTNSVASSGGRNVAYHAVLLPEGGTALRSLAPLLTYYEEDLRDVQIMGTSLWHREEVVREPALKGGVFAGPDIEAKQKFNDRFDAVYGEETTRLSSLAYDAVNIGAYIAAAEKEERTGNLTNSAGFFGVDGFVRFTEQGVPERGLAVYQIQNGEFVIIDPAPRTGDGAF